MPYVDRAISTAFPRPEGVVPHGRPAWERFSGPLVTTSKTYSKPIRLDSSRCRIYTWNTKGSPELAVYVAFRTALESQIVTKKEIVKTISEEIGLTQLKTKEIVQKTFDAIVETLVDEGRIELRNFGVFEVKKRAARKARNPRTGDRVDVPEKYVVTFKPGKEMEEKVRLMEEREEQEEIARKMKEVQQQDKPAEEQPAEERPASMPPTGSGISPTPPSTTSYNPSGGYEMNRGGGN